MIEWTPELSEWEYALQSRYGLHPWHGDEAGGKAVVEDMKWQKFPPRLVRRKAGSKDAWEQVP